MPPSNFRLASKNHFLTYPQCDLDTQYILDQLKDKCARYKPTYIVVASEHHQDGTLHRHAFIQLTDKSNIKDPRFYDIDGYHGRYESARDPTNSREYVCKDAEYVEWGQFRGGPQRRNSDAPYAAAFTDAGSKEEFLQLIREAAPRDYALNLERLEYVAEHTFKRVEELYVPRWQGEQFVVLPEMQRWVDQRLEVRSVPFIIRYG